MNRRDFVKKGCTSCLGVLILGLSLESCKSNTVFKTNITDKKIKIPIDKFRQTEKLIVRINTLDYDILVVKNKKTYKALYLKCTHRDNPVYLADNTLSCNLHGSTFDINGNVTNGPAQENLTIFDCFIDKDELVVQVGKA